MSLKDGEGSGTVPHGVTSGGQQRADLLELTLKGFLQHSSIFSSIIRGSVTCHMRVGDTSGGEEGHGSERGKGDVPGSLLAFNIKALG